MRLPNIPSNQVTSQQRPLFDKISTGIRENLQEFTTEKPDGWLIGPFNALLHFPSYGTPVWNLFLALAGSSVLPKAAREVSDLTGEESMACDVAAVLNRGHQVPNSTYGAAVAWREAPLDARRQRWHRYSLLGCRPDLVYRLEWYSRCGSLFTRRKAGIFNCRTLKAPKNE